MNQETELKCEQKVIGIDMINKTMKTYCKAKDLRPIKIVGEERRGKSALALKLFNYPTHSRETPHNVLIDESQEDRSPLGIFKYLGVDYSG